MNNLKYLYITIKNVNIENPGNALLYYEFYSKIFGFSFIKTLLGKLGDNEKECSKELFQEKYIGHLKYLNLKIFKEADRERYAPSSHETERYILDMISTIFFLKQKEIIITLKQNMK